jgi:sporulation-control protein
MFKKFLASVGIGGAKVDTQLERDVYVPLDVVRGQVLIQGGKTEQRIDRINLFVMTEALREFDDKKYYENVKIDSFTVGGGFTLRPNERKTIDFQFTLPAHTPPTLGKTHVWIQTGLDVPGAIDPKDRDYITVHPHPYMDTVLDAVINGLGFQLRKVEMEYSKRYRYIQEFEFWPSPEFRSRLDELEIIFFMKPSGLELMLQVDRRARGLGGLFAEALDMDESFVHVSFSSEEISQGSQYVANKLRNFISQYS